MTARSDHACRSGLEIAVCEEMGRQGVVHAHRSLRFRVQGARGRTTKYEPAIVAHRGPILFLIEPVSSPRSGAIERLSRFLEQHSAEIVLVAVTPEGTNGEIPPEAYDEIYTASEIGTMVARVHEQDPDGIVRPFVKPRRLKAGRTRDTPK